VTGFLCHDVHESAFQRLAPAVKSFSAVAEKVSPSPGVAEFHPTSIGA
jgi:hypothetical protein